MLYHKPLMTFGCIPPLILLPRGGEQIDTNHSSVAVSDSVSLRHMASSQSYLIAEATATCSFAIRSQALPTQMARDCQTCKALARAFEKSSRGWQPHIYCEP